MKVVLAPDSFKESVSAPDAAAALAAGVRQVCPDACCVEVPMADGGEGFTRAVAASLGARLRSVEVVDALGRPVTAEFAIAGERAIVEVAAAVGLGVIDPGKRDIRAASSQGVGQLIRAALDAGARDVLVGLGGSATSDAGAGMLEALGVRFLDGAGARLEPTPARLAGLARVDTSGLDPRLGSVTLTGASDVTNPLLGDQGAAAVFGPQKGATGDDVRFLDEGARRVERAVAAALPRAAGLADAPGAGAAGGLGWALLALGATLRPGVQIVADAVGLREILADADLVIAGEGALDRQTLDGKTPAGVAELAREAGVPCVLVGGSVRPGADALLGRGATALVPIVPGVVTLEDALADGAENLTRTAATIMRLATLGLAP
ncbi:MAG: glycerate kinase [Actinomycetaceae bacterium]|nr:glycerate kinase [Actinomycetaceae bacterium]MDU0970347.1 glycerate kinase [Actinomycetaceae bacterium]